MRSAAVRHEQFIVRVGAAWFAWTTSPKIRLEGLMSWVLCKNSGQAASCDQNALVASAAEFSLHKASAKAKRWGLLNSRFTVDDVMKTGGTYRTVHTAYRSLLALASRKVSGLEVVDDSRRY